MKRFFGGAKAANKIDIGFAAMALVAAVGAFITTVDSYVHRNDDETEGMK